jgi:hypothetical protein
MLSTKSERSVRARWFFGPVVDVAFVCGGLMWVLFGLYQVLCFVNGQNEHVFSCSYFAALSLMLSVMLAESHVIATHVRLYENSDLRRDHRNLIVVGPVLIVISVLILCLSPSLLSLAALVYVLASIHHGLRQCYGISLLYCRKQGYKLKAVERKLISIFLHSVTVFAILRQFAYPEFSKSPLRGVEVAFAQVVPEWIVGCALAVFVCLGLIVTVRMFVRAVRLNEWFPWNSAVLLLNASLVVIFSREIAGDLWIFVPGFFHGSQYLVVTAMHRVGSQRLADACRNQDAIIASCIQYVLTLLVFSALIYGGVPAILRGMGVDFNVACAAVFLAMVLHHFYADSLIWRLRDSSVTKPLVAE